MKFRLHKELFEDSMSEIKVFTDKKSFENYLNEIYAPYYKIDDIIFKYGFYDSRNKWETYYVLIKFFGKKNYIVSGMSDNILE